MRGLLEIASCTDPGVVRTFNEDSIAADPRLGLLVLADGMGGYKAGDVASRLATGMVTRELQKSLRTRPGAAATELLGEAIRNANRAIHHTAQRDPRCQGMGATVVALLFRSGKATIAHVGDSRLYRLRGNHLELLTHDHSLLQEQVELGLITSEDAKVSHNRNLVTRALGVAEEVALDLHEERGLPGDIFLLCSDGLNDMVDDVDIELVLRSLQANLPLAANQLVMIANDNGGHDNISVILARVRERAAPGWLGKLMSWFK